MLNMVDRIIEQIRNGEIPVEEVDWLMPIYPLNLLLQYGFATERIYGFDQ